MTTRKVEQVRIRKDGVLIADDLVISYLGTRMMKKGIHVDSPWCG